jgi:hypothetical protein
MVVPIETITMRMKEAIQPRILKADARAVSVQQV